ncbi:uncharacterized protein LOC117607058 [Osmia lignaria lignaria]|uniref:uncharacterized protein LOC117607058 n=1 Tax=Osmia lignaria lignaria TaxID=1437193 RepID=UPI001479554B|nr:uncharacterized protein LOC117607058 [Osmia lignaria]
MKPRRRHRSRQSEEKFQPVNPQGLRFDQRRRTPAASTPQSREIHGLLPRKTSCYSRTGTFIFSEVHECLMDITNTKVRVESKQEMTDQVRQRANGKYTRHFAGL